MTKIIVSVISDLVADQRVHKVSQTLFEQGFNVLLIGAKKRKSLPLTKRDYAAKRINMFFQKGFLFYAEWNMRLFFYLLIKKHHILLANDLDTLPANYIAGKLKRAVLVYDTHEFFTETAELYNRRFVKAVWVKIERFFFSRTRYIYTVSTAVAALYKARFNKEVLVIRNVPLLTNPKQVNTGYAIENLFKLPPNKKILLIQGSGLNENRGVEELVLATTLLPDDFILVIAGSGLIITKLNQLVVEHNLQNKVFFTGLMPFEQLQAVTQMAFCGFSLDKPLNINQQASLPNKIFDYLAANIPVITSNIKEVVNIVEQFKVGIIIDDVTPENIAEAVKKLASDKEKYTAYKLNTLQAINELNWNKEKKIIEILFKKITAENKLVFG